MLLTKMRYLVPSLLGISLCVNAAEMTQSVVERGPQKTSITYTITNANFDRVRLSLNPNKFAEITTLSLLKDRLTFRGKSASPSASDVSNYLFSFKLDAPKQDASSLNQDYLVKVGLKNSCKENDSACSQPFSLEMKNAFSEANGSDLFEVGIGHSNSQRYSTQMVKLFNSFNAKLDGQYKTDNKSVVLNLVIETNPQVFREVASQLSGKALNEADTLKVVDNIYKNFAKYLETQI